MQRLRKGLLVVCLAGVGAFAFAPMSGAAPLPDNCTKVQGTVTCSTFTGPGNNQAGVGSTETDETQGNTTNVSPAPQDLTSECAVKPPTSQGAPNTCP